MNILLVGSNETSKQYIHVLKEKNKHATISMIAIDSDVRDKLERIQYYSNFSEAYAASTIDLVIICEEYSRIDDDIDQLLSLSIPIIWDSQFMNTTKDLRVISQLVKEKNTKLLLASQSRFAPQVIDVHENIAKGRIGNLGVVNMKRHSHIDHVKSHEHELQAELETLYPYVFQVNHVFAMNRKYAGNHYMTVILKLEAASIINVEIYTGDIECHRSGEFTGQQGVLNYSSDLQTMVLKKTNQSLKKWTPTVINTYINIVEYVNSEYFDMEKVVEYLDIHEQLLMIKEAILESVKIGAPVHLKEDVSHA